MTGSANKSSKTIMTWVEFSLSRNFLLGVLFVSYPFHLHETPNIGVSLFSKRAVEALQPSL